MSFKEKQKMAGDGIQYKKAKTWQIIFSQAASACGMCFFALMTYATYIGNAGFGILVGVTGIIITGTRIFDSVTDPLCAYIIERFESPFGKIRIFQMGGWALMALSTTSMCNWAAGKLSGIAGLLFFILMYLVYILGYTMLGVSSNTAKTVMTNDPKQRPVFSVWSTVYSYLTPTITMMVGMAVILPKHNGDIGISFLKEYNLFILAVAFVLVLLSCIGVSEMDKNENFLGIMDESKKEEKPGFRDMWDLICHNKEMQRYMVAAVSDKLMQTIGAASVITTMLYGILVGDMGISQTINSIAMLPSIGFAIAGSVLAGRYGNKKVMVQWTWACIIMNIGFAAYLLFADTTRVAVSNGARMIFLFFMFANYAVKMVVSVATGAMGMDVTDYELYRTGKYMPATVSATYSFIDKLISSFGATIATFAVALIGYTTTAPQPGDPLTSGVKILTVVLYCGFPIIGWICTLISMRKYSLTREKMIEIQKNIANKKTEAIAATKTENA